MKPMSTIRSLLFTLAALTPALQAAIITPTGATSSLGNLSARPIEHTIDGSGLSSGGLSGDILSETHVVSSANDGPYFIGAINSVLTFDLGGAYTVDTVHLWTYSRTGQDDRGIASFDISFSTDGGVTFDSLPTLSISGVAIGTYPEPIAVQSFSFAPQSGVTNIRLDNIVNHGDGSYTGLSEIRFEGAVAFGFQITSVNESGNDLTLSWASQAGRLYDILGTTSPSVDPQVWTPVVSDIPSTPPENTEVITKPGDAFTAFAVIEKPIPPLFSDDFETDKGWTTGVDGGTDTDWERGTPGNVGPPAANSPVTCYGTNIDAKYGLDVDIHLRSPAIDLSGATSATLAFQQFHDIEVQWDAGAVRVLRAGDLTQLGADVLNPVDGTITEWTQFSGALPAEALGESIILEFRFTSDNVEPLAQAGWYIDDVSVTAE